MSDLQALWSGRLSPSVARLYQAWKNSFGGAPRNVQNLNTPDDPQTVGGEVIAALKPRCPQCEDVEE